MTRVEQLSRVLKFLAEKAEEKSEGTFEEMTVWHLGTIGTILADISQSLAVIADSMSREDEKESEEDKRRVLEPYDGGTKHDG